MGFYCLWLHYLSFSFKINVTMPKLPYVDSMFFHFQIYACDNLKIQNVIILALEHIPKPTASTWPSLATLESCDPPLEWIRSGTRSGDDCISIGLSWSCMIQGMTLALETLGETRKRCVARVVCEELHLLQYRQWSLYQDMSFKNNFMNHVYIQ